MSKVSQELSVDYNRHPVGLHGGKSIKELHDKHENILESHHENDEINPPNELTCKGEPDKELFESSKP